MNRPTTSTSTRCARSKRHWSTSPAAPWSSPTIAGSSTAPPPKCWPSRATATSNGSRATTRTTRPTGTAASAPTPTSRTGSSTSRWCGPRRGRPAMHPLDYVKWGDDWAWGVPLIALNVVIHVFCLAMFTARVERLLGRYTEQRHFALTFALVMGVAVILVTGLHILEAGIWAAAYGHADIPREAGWQMRGALEALNGMLLFGLTTAFLFAMIQRVWPAGNR